MLGYITMAIIGYANCEHEIFMWNIQAILEHFITLSVTKDIIDYKDTERKIRNTDIHRLPVCLL